MKITTLFTALFCTLIIAIVPPVPVSAAGNCADSDAYAIIAFSGTDDGEGYYCIPEDFGELTPDWFASGAVSGEPVSEQQVRDTGASLFEKIIPYFKDVEKVTKTGDLFFLYNTPSDFGGVAFTDSRNGQTLFAGGTVWAGLGDIVIPEESIRKPADGLIFRDTAASDPAELVFLESKHVDNWSGENGEGNRVWQMARRTSLVKSFAECGDYKAVVYLYTPGVGCTNIKAARAIVLITGRTTDEFAIQRVHVSGKVTSDNGTPLCAMVLANGQHMFTCGRDSGFYALNVPPDENGVVTLFAFCDGFVPFGKTLYSGEISWHDYNITMTAASENTPRIAFEYQMGTASENPGWAKITGEVRDENGTPLCAMVLANGQHTFTCGSPGEFGLEAPPDAWGEITLFVFCDGFAPLKHIMKVSDI